MLIHQIHRVAQCADDIVLSAIASQGLTVRQFLVLHTIANQQGCNQTSIVATTGVDRSTVGGIVKRLFDRGLVTRERTEKDQRAYTVVLTTAGQELHQELEEDWHAAEDELLHAVLARDRKAFIRSLKRIIEDFGPIKSAQTSHAYRK